MATADESECLFETLVHLSFFTSTNYSSRIRQSSLMISTASNFKTQKHTQVAADSLVLHQEVIGKLTDLFQIVQHHAQSGSDAPSDFDRRLAQLKLTRRALIGLGKFDLASIFVAVRLL